MTIDYNSESRLRAIALNAVREAMLVYSRWDKPFTDDDAARIENIYQILHLVENRSEYEHAPLIADQQTEVTSPVRKIADLLANVALPDAATDRFDEAPPVKIKIPKSTTTLMPTVA